MPNNFGRRVLSTLLLGALGAAFAVRESVRFHNEANTRRHLAKYTHLPRMGAFTETLPRFSFGVNKQKHAVLLVHGYSASPNEFAHVIAALEQAGIPYYAPMLTGFGLDTTRLLHHATFADWVRDVINAYDLLASLAESVSMVGHSTGATLAIAIAEHRPVRHLILTGPNFAPGSADKTVRALAMTPVISQIMRWAVPVFNKPHRPGRVTWSDTLDPHAANKAFSYPAMPSQSLLEVYKLQDVTDICRAQYQKLSILYGAQDETVDIEGALQMLDAHKIAYTKHIFPNSAHNIFQDYDREAAAQTVAQILEA